MTSNGPCPSCHTSDGHVPGCRVDPSGAYQLTKRDWFGSDPYDDFFTDYEEPDHEEQYMKRTVRWGFVSAVILGVFLALWLLSGDTRPEAAGATTTAQITVSRFLVKGAGDIDFFRVALGDGALVISLDHDMPLAKWLRDHQGKQTMTLEAR